MVRNPAELLCRSSIAGMCRGRVQSALLSTRVAALSPEIIRALREDLEASAKSPDDIVGLDGDPFSLCAGLLAALCDREEHAERR